MSPVEKFAIWITRSCIGLLVYLGVEMRSDIRMLKDTQQQIPALQQQILDMKERQSRLEIKVYSSTAFAKKPDELNFDQLIKF